MTGKLAEHYPWLAGPWSRLQAYVLAERMPHGLLITGPRGLGKQLLAKEFARRLLCRSVTGGLSCGGCAACRLLQAGTHPDFLMVEPVEAGKTISVDAVRDMIGVLSLRPQYGGFRIVVLAPADQMSRSAVNSLLKTLEEPDSRTVLLLLSEAPENLPATIRSRCHRIAVLTPPRDVAVAWLREHQAGDQAENLCSMARGAPLRALELLGTTAAKRRLEVFESWLSVVHRRQDPVAAAVLWEKSSAEEVIAWLASWLEDLVRLRVAWRSAVCNNADLQEPLRAAARRLDLKELFQNLDLAYRAQRALGGQINRQFLLEELAIYWSRSTVQ